MGDRNEQVLVECLACKQQSKTEMTFSGGKYLPDDFILSCGRCGHREEGTLPVSTFNLIG